MIQLRVNSNLNSIEKIYQEYIIEANNLKGLPECTGKIGIKAKKSFSEVKKRFTWKIKFCDFLNKNQSSVKICENSIPYTLNYEGSQLIQNYKFWILLLEFNFNLDFDRTNLFFKSAFDFISDKRSHDALSSYYLEFMKKKKKFFINQKKDLSTKLKPELYEKLVSEKLNQFSETKLLQNFHIDIEPLKPTLVPKKNDIPDLTPFSIDKNRILSLNGGSKTKEINLQPVSNYSKKSKKNDGTLSPVEQNSSKRINQEGRINSISRFSKVDSSSIERSLQIKKELELFINERKNDLVEKNYIKDNYSILSEITAKKDINPIKYCCQYRCNEHKFNQSDLKYWKIDCDKPIIPDEKIEKNKLLTDLKNQRRMSRNKFIQLFNTFTEENMINPMINKKNVIHKSLDVAGTDIEYRNSIDNVEPNN